MTEQQAQQAQAAPDTQADAPTGEGYTDWHPDHTKATANLQAELDKRVEAVRNSQNMAADEKHRTIRELWHRAQGAYEHICASYEKALQGDVDELERKVFRVAPNLRDSVRSAYNDLYDRTILGLESGDREAIGYATEELERLMDRAIRTGDKALEVAVGQRAIELGIAGLRDSYLARSKERSQAWAEYTQVRKQLANWHDPQERMWRNLTGGGALRKPGEA